ncbi:MAG: hemolysin family protein [Bacteroidales bacterium]|jgi:CBS domain containing-hemolysin-like protein|nr:hemolysin family protein [Bacteroidales bacterium]
MDSILIILTTIILSAFFSGMEIAFVTANKLRIELDRKQGIHGSGIVKKFADNPGQFIATMLIGNNVALVVYGLFFSRLLTPMLLPYMGSDAVVLVVNTIISTALILTVAEFLPKTVFSLSPNFFLKGLSIPTVFFFFLFSPVSRFTLAISNLLIKVFFKNGAHSADQENLVFSKKDLDHFIKMSRQINEESEPDHHNFRIFRNALDFSNVKLRECMIPRTEIVAYDVTGTVSGLKEKFVETGYSRILIYSGTIDNITGYFELKDIFRNPPDISSGMRKMAIVPETMPANKLLRLFVEEKKNIALVVDEFGGTSGIVTIEDVLEEIVGDIEDEHDTNELIEKKINDREYVFSARLEIDYLNETYGLGLPEGDEYETLAGLIFLHNGNIPSGNEIIKIKNFHFRILRVTATRLELVKLKIQD